MRRYHFLNRLLVITGVVAVLPLSVGFLLIQHSAKARLADAAGGNFVLFAEHAASAVDTIFIGELELLTTVAAMSPESRTPELLTSLEQSSRPYREIVVLSATGDIETATGDATRDDEAFKKALEYASASDATRTAGKPWAAFDESQDLLTFYVPIQASAGAEIEGFVRGSIDTERLFRGVSDVRFGETGHACLIERESGKVLAGPSSQCAADGKFAWFRDYQRAREQNNPYFLGGVEGPASFDRADAELVAYARPELSSSFAALDWSVMVEQSLAETHAPLAPLSRDLILYFLGMGVLVVMLAGFLSYLLEKPLSHVAVDLHEEAASTAS